jgi:hypothetical protein
VILRYRFGLFQNRLVGIVAIGLLLAQTLATAGLDLQRLAPHGNVIGVVCHGASPGAGHAGSSDVPPSDKPCQVCCVCCTAAFALAVNPPLQVPRTLRHVALQAPRHRAFLRVNVAAVRAGQSQAPPRFA